MQWHRNQHLKSQNDMLRAENARCKKMVMLLTVVCLFLSFALGVYEWTV